MDKKYIYFLEAIAVFLVLAAVNFFYNMNTTNSAMHEYRFQMDNMSALVSRCLVQPKLPSSAPPVLESHGKHKFYALRSENSKLLEDNDLLMRENAELKQRLEKSNLDDGMIAEMKQNIKEIAVDIDEIDISHEKLSQLDDILRSIYKELSSLDLNLAKMSSSETPPWEEIREQEAAISRKFDELASVVKGNQNLAQQVLGNRDGLQALGVKINSLEDNEANLKKLAAQVSALENDNKNKELKILATKVTALEKESKGKHEFKKALARDDELMKRIEAGSNRFKKIERKINFLERDKSVPKELAQALEDNEANLKKLAAQVSALENDNKNKELKILATKVTALEKRGKNDDELKIALKRSDSLSARMALSEEMLSELKQKVRQIESDWKKRLARQNKNKKLVYKLTVLEKKLNSLVSKRKKFESKSDKLSR